MQFYILPQAVYQKQKLFAESAHTDVLADISVYTVLAGISVYTVLADSSVYTVQPAIL